MVDRIASGPRHAYPLPDSRESPAAPAAAAPTSWTQSSVESLAPQQNTAPVESSYFARAKNWLWSLFGWETKAASSSPAVPTQQAPPSSGPPQLVPPEATDRKRMEKAVSDLNRDFVYRLKDIAEFEEEMQRGGSNKLDKLIFLELVYSNLYQKQLKEDEGINLQKLVLDIQERNKALQRAKHNILEELSNIAKTDSKLKWVHIGLTVGMMGGIAVGIFLGGIPSILSLGMGITGVGKGGTMLAQDHYKRKAEHDKADLYGVSHEMQVNSGRIEDDIGEMQSVDEDIASLLKMMRHILDNQSQAERSFFGQNT